MKNLKGCFHIFIFISILSALFLSAGCDNGEKAVDGLTGHQAVKQYNETKDDIDDIVNRQNERFNSLDEEEDEDLIFEEDEE